LEKNKAASCRMMALRSAAGNLFALWRGAGFSSGPSGEAFAAACAVSEVIFCSEPRSNLEMR
jgi:hypothetical protein